MVSRPWSRAQVSSVGAVEEGDVVHHAAGQPLAQQAADGVGLGRHDEQPLARGNLVGQAYVALRHFGQHRRPVRPGVRPRELHAALWIPLGGQRPAAPFFGLRRQRVEFQL